VALDAKLLEILACPEDKGPLLYFEDESALYNPRLKRRYAVRDDIPIMLIDEAEGVAKSLGLTFSASGAASVISAASKSGSTIARCSAVTISRHSRSLATGAKLHT